MDPATATALLVASAAVKTAGGFAEASAQKKALSSQITQEKIAYSKQQIDADQQIQELNANQIGKASTSGFEYGGSFANLTSSNMDKFMQDSELRKLNEKMQISQFESAKQDANRNAWLNAFSSFSSTIEPIYKINKD